MYQWGQCGWPLPFKCIHLSHLLTSRLSCCLEGCNYMHGSCVVAGCAYIMHMLCACLSFDCSLLLLSPCYYCVLGMRALITYAVRALAYHAIVHTSALQVLIHQEGWKRHWVMDCLQQGLRQLAKAIIAKSAASRPATCSALFIFVLVPCMSRWWEKLSWLTVIGLLGCSAMATFVSYLYII